LQIDEFLIAREGSVLNKLLAIGGVERLESFEIQVKAHLVPAPGVEMQAHIDAVMSPLLNNPNPQIKVVKHSHYRQYDTYFLFADENQGRVRYREDDALDKDRQVKSVRARLTFTMPTKEREFEHAMLLSRSQFIAAAQRPLRFYREYFRPTFEHEVQKERLRWHVLYKGVLFYVNVDTVTEPAIDGVFLEIKSQTWSRTDAEYKASLMSELLDILKLTPEKRIYKEYLEFVIA
jgi:5-methylthioadenosine/S-adenosylhomocysteine deaminase